MEIMELTVTNKLADISVRNDALLHFWVFDEKNYRQTDLSLIVEKIKVFDIPPRDVS